MRVILKQDIKGVGKKWEVKNVADGYAVNSLIPRKLAEYGSPEAIKKVESLRSMIEAEKKIQESLAKEAMEKLKNIHVLIKAKSNSAGYLFAAIHEVDISKALKEQANIDLAPEFLHFSRVEAPIKQRGSHTLKAVVGNIEQEFVVEIEGEE